MPVPAAMSAKTGASSPLAELKARVDALTTPPTGTGRAFAFGLPALDDRLAAGGLSAAALHEACCASISLADECATTQFLAGVAGRMARDVAAPALWVLTSFDLYAPGLEQVGLPASRVIFAEARDDAEALACAEDAVRDGTPAVVVVEARRVAMVASRRLQLAAGDRGVPVLLHRRRRRTDVDPLGEPSAAATRWRIGCAPSPPPKAGLARARWSIELVRQRGGASFSLELEACDNEGRLAVPAPAVRRTAPAAGAAVTRAA